ncbi:sensor histidine kinase [Cohnella suwonensis]|uniref:histidine kinase n=1 Tax=Cohnella suwonensis TaxID=696072 RepID=A0ABW0LVR4_9BACL
MRPATRPTRSLFRQTLFASVAIGVVVLLLLTATINWVVQKDFYRQSFDRLGERAAGVERAYGAYSRGETSLAEFRKRLREIEQENGVRISVVGKRVKFLKQDLYEIGVKPDVRGWVASVSEGNRVEKVAKLRKQDATMVVVGFPLLKNGQVAASAFVYEPSADVKRLAMPIRRSIWLVALLCAGPVILLLWFATRRLVAPIRRMGNAAVAIAQGDFTSRVETRGNDEIARLGESFNVMAERMERVEDQRSRLISEISHDLRTPLTSIRGTLQAISDGILTGDEQKEFVGLGLSETARLGKLIDQLQELSAFEEHRVRFDFRKTDLAALAEKTVRQLSPKAEQAGMVFAFEGDLTAGVIARVDPDRMKQAFVNLIGNAVDHNPPGTRVAVRLQGGRRTATIVVEDDGQGVDPKHLPHLFERLYKADSSRASKGSGLGLTIVRHIVQAHGGTIRAESEPGKGTAIRIELPVGGP